MVEISGTTPPVDEGSAYDVTYRFRHEPSDSMVGATRAMVHGAMRAWGIPDGVIYDAAGWATGALVANAVRSVRSLGDSPVPALASRQYDDIEAKVQIVRNGEKRYLRIQVTDSNPDLPPLPDSQAWNLLPVELISAQFGCVKLRRSRRGFPRKQVWAKIEII
jgi:hypothetical protein